MLSPEELLLDRFLVENDFPFNNYYKVGGIITDPGGNTFVRNENGYPVHACEFASFPKIFRKLNWWEYRDEKDLPKYLRALRNNGGLTKKIYSVNSYSHRGEMIDHVRLNNGMPGYLNWFLPATQKGYEDFINSKK